MELFVYGSLLSGERNHFVLGDSRFLRTGRTLASFELVDLGEYPAMLAGGATAVVGEVYAVAAELIAEVDRFEDAPRTYRRARIELEDGTFAETYLYILDRLVGARRIAGSWRDR